MSSYTDILTRRDEWVYGLVSGAYEQKTGVLVGTMDGSVHPDHDDDVELGYCCLGVCYVVLGEKLPNPFHMTEEKDGFGDEVYDHRNDDGYDDEDAYGSSHFVKETLNDEMKEFLGLTDWQVNILINLNDTGTQFHTIAETIRKFPVYVNGVETNA